MSERTLTTTRASTTRVRVNRGLHRTLGQAIAAHVGSTDVPTLLVTDSNVGKQYGQAAIESLRAADLPCSSIEMEPGEKSKSLTSAELLLDYLADTGFPRDGIIIALGGGVVSDLAGFIAATWMRGVRWIACPTTLEAMIDASIGGKTAVNFPGGKNLVGAFHHPDLVLIDPDCLETLSARDFRAGLAESIKHAAIFNSGFFDWHEQNIEAILIQEPEVIRRLIDQNVAIKIDIVQRDATEQSGERMLLNFGHTIGHAIEECVHFELRHGECVALGTVAACRISGEIASLSEQAVDRVVQLLNKFELPTVLDDAPTWHDALETMRRDKKSRAGKMQFVLLEHLGKPIIRNDVPESAIRTAYESLRK